jgi:hypothetical protein
MHRRSLACGGFRFDPDFHVVPEGIEETEETVRGETAQLPSDKCRYFGLVDVENSGGLSAEFEISQYSITTRSYAR